MSDDKTFKDIAGKVHDLFMTVEAAKVRRGARPRTILTRSQIDRDLDRSRSEAGESKRSVRFETDKGAERDEVKVKDAKRKDRDPIEVIDLTGDDTASQTETYSDLQTVRDAQSPIAGPSRQRK